MKKLAKIVIGVFIFSSFLINISEISAMSARVRDHLEKAKERHRREKYERHNSESSQNSNYEYESDYDSGSYTIRLRCSPCNGTGKKNCWQCNGNRGHWETVTVPKYGNNKATERVWKNCSACNGTGKRECEDCRGLGYTEQDNRGNRIK